MTHPNQQLPATPPERQYPNQQPPENLSGQQRPSRQPSGSGSGQQFANRQQPVTRPGRRLPNQPADASGMTEEEQQRHKNMIVGGIALAAVPIVLSIILSAAEAPLDPRFTGPVFSAMLIAAAAAFGQAYRLKRDAKRRGGPYY